MKYYSVFAMNFYKTSNHDLISLQKILGHKNINATTLYAYTDNTDVKEASDLYCNKRDSKDKNIKDRIKALKEDI